MEKSRTTIFLGETDGVKLKIYHLDYFRAYLETIKGKIRIIVEKDRKQRSSKHNKYWHGIFCQIVAEWMGDGVDDACRAIKKGLGRPYHWTGKDKFGNQKDFYWSTADMDDKELGELEEKARAFIAPFGVIVPDKKKEGVDNSVVYS